MTLRPHDHHRDRPRPEAVPTIETDQGVGGTTYARSGGRPVRLVLPSSPQPYVPPSGHRVCLGCTSVGRQGGARGGAFGSTALWAAPSMFVGSGVRASAMSPVSRYPPGAVSAASNVGRACRPLQQGPLPLFCLAGLAIPEGDSPKKTAFAPRTSPPTCPPTLFQIHFRLQATGTPGHPPHLDAK